MSSSRAPGSDWRAIVGKNGTPEFAAAFSQNVSLHTSVMNAPCVGVEQLSAFLLATSSTYERLAFTHETVDGPKTYLEWEGRAFGADVAGSTIITRNPAGLIEIICLHHRPLQVVLRFSAELARRLEGKLGRAMFEIPR